LSANALRDAGWPVLRFTADDVLKDPNSVITHVAKAIMERR
jgi:very-short-patch-repair endonuclease